LSEPKRSETIYFEEGKYYLIGFELPRGQYIAAQAFKDGSNWSLEGHRTEDVDGYYIYNKLGNIVGSIPYDSGQELSIFENAVSAAILAYNGESVYFEPDYELELPEEFTIIP
jgi:hypothetical protein